MAIFSNQYSDRVDACDADVPTGFCAIHNTAMDFDSTRFGCTECEQEAEDEIHREWDARYHMIASQQPIEFAGMTFDDMAF